jgi:hypothetical protein
MCTQKAPNNYADQLYNRYGNIYENYLKDKVLPAIRAKNGESPMLQEFAKRWKNHKLLVRQMWKLFVYLVSSSLCPLPGNSFCFDFYVSAAVMFFRDRCVSD